MTPKDKSDQRPPAADAKARRQLTVVSSQGVRHRFLRGMITHDLVQRGLPFDGAYTVAQAIRERLGERDEVSTAEIRELIREELEILLGAEPPAHLLQPPPPPPDLHVLHQGGRRPFSRGLLARSIQAAGIELDRAYPLIAKLLDAVREEEIDEIASEEVVRRVGDLIERYEGREAARHFRLARRINRLPRPLVIYVGGASGTGKSTLSLEMAPLLRVFRISATDTIRQVMRMMFSPTMLPALHSSSFEAAPSEPVFAADLSTEGGHESLQRIQRSFQEQARSVLVGVRAVVERAIAENLSVLVEGVHLYPPMVPFADLEGAVYQIPLMLGTLDEESHRSRFLTRARLGGRRAERYLENFTAIRAIHDFVLQQAESHDVPILDTSDGDPPVTQTLRVVTGMLEPKIVSLDQRSWGGDAEPPPTLLLLIDGMADRPLRSLGGRTALQAADTPTLDRLAAEGQCGLADPLAPGAVPDTASGSLALFGQSPRALKRGPVEALGAGVTLSAGDIALRGNLATLDEAGNLIDRRAGRIRDEAEELAKVLDRLPLPASYEDEVEVRVRAATEHRLAIVLRGQGLSSAIEGSDPGDGAPAGPPLSPRPLDPSDESAVQTARLLAVFEQEARHVLQRHKANRRRKKQGLPPANAVISRGAGRIHRLVPLQASGIPLRLTCIAGDRTLLGIAWWLGAETVHTPVMTANLDTDVDAKFDAALQGLRRSDLVIVHLKGADIAAHDKRPDLKVAFLERVDRGLARLLEHHPKPMRVAVASDHATLSESGQHAADPPPVLIWGEGIPADSVDTFDEQSAGAGELQRFPLQMLLGRLFDLR